MPAIQLIVSRDIHRSYRRLAAELSMTNARLLEFLLNLAEQQRSQTPEPSVTEGNAFVQALKAQPKSVFVERTPERDELLRQPNSVEKVHALLGTLTPDEKQDDAKLYAFEVPPDVAATFPSLSIAIERPQDEGDGAEQPEPDDLKDFLASLDDEA